ncbi:MAG: hypothetical protein JWO22_3588 [Frankiales bacterium]|nr:hypothetical protein [Frankiales bacterium]
MRTWGLGLRLALQANRVRLVVTALAVSFTVAFLLGALGALPARQAKLDRLNARDFVSVDTNASKGLKHPPRVTLETANGWYRGKPFTVRLVEAEPGAPRPPGLDRYPGPGEVMVSPDLRAAMQAHPKELASRVPGRVVDLLPDAALSGPHELFAYVGVAKVRYGQVVQHFGYHPRSQPTPVELKIAAWLGAVGLLVPVLVLVGTATRLSASSRDRRLSALRLVGATPRQARAIAATEGLVAGIAGVAGGLAFFWLLRRPACALLPFPDGVFAQDLMPTGLEWTVVVLGVPLLAVTTGVVSLRKVVTGPLGVRRQAPLKSVGWWRLVPVLVGLGMLVAMRLRADRWAPGHGIGTGLLLGGGGLTVIGLAVAAPAVSRLGGRLLSRMPGISPSLAAGRIESDPTASARVVTGMVLVLFVTAWLLAFLPVLQANRGSSDAALLQTLPKGLLTTGSAIEPVDLGAVRALPGVRAVVDLGRSTVAGPGRRDPDDAHSVTVASCTALGRALGRDLGCGTSKVHRIGLSDWRPGTRVDVLDADSRVTSRLALPAVIPTLGFPAQLLDGGFFDGDLLVDPSLLQADAGTTRLVIRTDGTAAAVERARAALPLSLAFTATTLQEQVATTGQVYLGYLRAVRIGLVLALLIGAASLAVTTADAVNERRRSLATLVAFGTPLRVLRRSVLLQMGAPMLTNVVAALAAAAVASACYLGTLQTQNGETWSLPWGSWALAALTAGVAVLLATAATLPLVSAIGRPEALRAE